MSLDAKAGGTKLSEIDRLEEEGLDIRKARSDLYNVDSTGEMHCHFHRGQMKAWNSEKRIIMVLAGTQSGKTSWGPFWLLREIQRRGPGDYLIAAPTFKLLSLKLFPEFLRLFSENMKYGRFTGKGSFQDRFLFNNYGCKCLFGEGPYENDWQRTRTQIYFGHAMQPDSLESATVKAAWLDEAGQKFFKLGAYEAVRRRLSINRGRCLITTTPYSLGWLKDLIYDPWKKAVRENGPVKGHPYIDVIQFKSTENPCFPMQEYLDTKATMPAWRHKMFYDGEFDKPAGAIYEDFDEDKHKCSRFVIPPEWPRYTGIDFGGVHTAAVFLAEGQRDGSRQFHGIRDSTKKLFLYREYPERGLWRSLTAKNHVEAILKGEPDDEFTGRKIKPKAYGGAKSEQQWRDEFAAGGLPVYEPLISDVEPGINRVISCFKLDELIIFDDCYATLDHIQNYSREVDDKGNPLEDIENKEDYHYCDALRYIISYLRGGRKQFWVR